MNFNNNGDWLKGGPFEHLRDLTNMNEKMRQSFGPQFLQNIIKQMPTEELNMLKNRLPNWELLFGVDPSKGTATATPSQSQHPFIDIYQTRQEVVAVVEVPGLASANEVRVNVTPTTLTVTGSLEGRFAMFKEERFDLNERFRGPFERTVDLPHRIKTTQTRARYHNGLLEIRMLKDSRKTKASTGRHIPISF
jgi:HSP20 family molecular chaperone IbpA